ncbi:MAG: CoA-binding protein [Syntrophales bacterium]|nr:CoA-binding protein [Syntrophales bacterium]
MKALFNPRSIAVIGATADLSRIGGLPIRFLLQHHYTGRIYPINPKYNEIAGLPCFPALADIAEPVDLALVGIPKRGVMDALKACAVKKIPYVILFSAGYAETGEAGRREQEDLRRFARENGIRLMGPNCLGLINPHDHVATSFTSGLTMDSIIAGRVGLITQSGGVGNCLMTRASDRSIGLSYFVSSGNEVDLEVSDFMEYMIDDERTRSIAVLIESLKDPARFARTARRALKAGKAVVALKVGRSEMGQKATASHTGAMSGADALYEALFRQCGVSRVRDIDDLLEVANLFACSPPPRGNRVAILSSSGGLGALMADLASDHNLQLPQPSRHTRERLTDLMPAVTGIANPMDLTTQFINDPDATARYVRTFVEDENYDVVIVNFTFSAAESSMRIAEGIVAMAPSLEKPLIVSWPVGIMAGRAFSCLEQAGIPLFFHPSRCLAAVGHFARYGMYRKSMEY